jgi:hypothetical protein
MFLVPHWLLEFSVVQVPSSYKRCISLLLVGDLTFYWSSEFFNGLGAKFDEIFYFSDNISYLVLIELPINGHPCTWNNMQSKSLHEQLNFCLTHSP